MQYSEKERIAILEAELASAVERAQAAEQDGAEIAERAHQAISSLQDEIASLQHHRNAPSGLCDQCDDKRQFLMVSATLALFLASVRYIPSGEWRGQLFGSICLACSVYYARITCQLTWMHFKRSFQWLSWTNNNIYRRVQTQWNRAVSVFLIK